MEILFPERLCHFLQIPEIFLLLHINNSIIALSFYMTGILQFCDWHNPSMYCKCGEIGFLKLNDTVQFEKPCTWPSNNFRIQAFNNHVNFLCSRQSISSADSTLRTPVSTDKLFLRKSTSVVKTCWTFKHTRSFVHSPRKRELRPFLLISWFVHSSKCRSATTTSYWRYGYSPLLRNFRFYRKCLKKAFSKKYALVSIHNIPTD